MNKKQKEFLEKLNNRTPSFDVQIQSKGIELNDLYKLDNRNQFEKVKEDGLRSLFLEQNPKFIALVDEVHRWNQDVENFQIGKLKSMQHGHWRNSLIKNLVNMMKEVIITSDRQVQNKFLDNTYEWYLKETSTKGMNIDQPKQGSQSRPQTSTSEMRYSASENNFYNLFSNSEFERGNRSRHPTLDPPEDRYKISDF